MLCILPRPGGSKRNVVLRCFIVDRCMCVCVCVCMYACMCVYMYVCTFVAALGGNMCASAFFSWYVFSGVAV
jgi:hypothetical protein